MLGFSLNLNYLTNTVYSDKTNSTLSRCLSDEKVDEDSYLAEFEEFSKNKKYIDAFQKAIDDQGDIAKIQEEKQTFDNALQEKGNSSLFDSLANIDKTQTLTSILRKAKLSELSGEIMKLTEFVKSNNGGTVDSKRDAAIIFLVSLDYLVKGLITHWQITLKDDDQANTLSEKYRAKLKEKAPMLNYGVKYNILLGDQFHAKAYYMTSRLGSNELWKILSTIEENFAKILFRKGYNGDSTHNLKKLYQDFYNYLPTFFGHGFKGLAIIHEMGVSDIEHSFKLGIEYGFWVQFGIFSYIMTAVANSGSKDVIKEKLKKISSLLQIISYETLEQILKQMSIFKYNNLKKDFAELSMMHGTKCYEILDEMDVDDEIKLKMRSHLNEFFNSLLKTTNIPEFA